MPENHWDKAAQKYDLFLPVTQHFSQLALDWITLGETNVSCILDIACGTGNFAHLAAKRFPNAGILATDFSPHMIKILETKSREMGLERIKSLVQDGQDLKDVASESVHLAASIFGLIFFPDREKAWKEIYRVLVPGAEAFVATWVNPDSLVLIEQAIERITGTYPESTNEIQMVRCLNDGKRGVEEIKKSAPFSVAEYKEETMYWDCDETTVHALFDMIWDNPVIKSAASGIPPEQITKVLWELLAERRKEDIYQFVFKGIVFKVIK